MPVLAALRNGNYEDIELHHQTEFKKSRKQLIVQIDAFVVRCDMILFYFAN
jgi:hypothetical protein